MLDVRLARLALPLPVELAIRRALVHPERATQHEGLVLAWELGVRILAGSLWAACRAIGANSTALETVASKLDRPSLGHWVELERTCAALLRGRTEPEAQAFRSTLDGLEQPLPADGGLLQLAGRIGALATASSRSPVDSAQIRARPKPRRVQELLDLLPHYRNEAQSTHGDVPPAFREESVAALLEGLIEFCERVPLLGDCALIFVRKLERATDGHVAEIARLHGNSVSWSSRKLDRTLWEQLAPARPYLFREPDLVLPLFPMAAVTSSGAEWHVGWYARQVHTPTVSYQGVAGQEFQLALAPDDLAAILRGARGGTDGVSAEFARLDPYRGLLAYEEEHAAIFFGREEETESAVARIEERGALFVYGASGSGKSSWLRAGIVPALRAKAALAGRTLKPIVVLPGERPLTSLRRALITARGGSPEELAAWTRAVDDALPERGAQVRERALAPLLRGLAANGAWPVLLVDQLEEAALSAIDRTEGRAFLELVAGAAASAMDVGAVVLASARADLLAPLIEHESVRRFLQTDGWPIGSIPPDRLARVIVEPLRGRKVGVEPGLPETIVGDIGDEPGALALLSQVLTTLWSERERFGGALTRQGYVDAGRVSGALEKQAETALAELVASSPDAGKRVDRLFRALAQSDEGERFTRRRVKLASLASELETSDAELRALAAPFVKRRLIVLGGDDASQTIEVAHERLLDAWPRLKSLLASERESLELRREVESASSAWEASGRRREQWTDGTSKLRRSEELVALGRLDLDTRGRAFLAASRAGVRRRKRIERVVLVSLGLLVVLASGATWLAYQASVGAGRAAALSQIEARRADAAAREATRLKDEIVEQSRGLRIRGLTQDLANFAALDDTLDYALSQARPAHEWWLERAHRLVDGVAEDATRGTSWSPGLADVEAQLAALRARAEAQTDAERALESTTGSRTWLFADSDDQGLHAQLSALARDLGRLKEQIAVAERSVRDPEAVAAWNAAIEAIATSEKYRGVKWPSGDRLTPQLGLVPIGPDPASGMWEFSHLESGAVATRISGNSIVPRPEDGLVFVLLPGGRVPVEVVPDGMESRQDATLTTIDLVPFLVSKYEMTNAQWDRLGGRQRDRERTGDALHPINRVSWDDCQAVLRRLLPWVGLPTEAQWEYACRAGTSMLWSTGMDANSLYGYANLEVDEESMGWRRLEHVGSFHANRWGLHDFHGNVVEWCQDGHEDDHDSMTRLLGDGLLDVLHAEYRVLRGGDVRMGSASARSSMHHIGWPEVPSGGLRPARRITP